MLEALALNLYNDIMSPSTSIENNAAILGVVNIWRYYCSKITPCKGGSKLINVYGNAFLIWRTEQKYCVAKCMCK